MQPSCPNTQLWGPGPSPAWPLAPAQVGGGWRVLSRGDLGALPTAWVSTKPGLEQGPAYIQTGLFPAWHGMCTTLTVPLGGIHALSSCMPTAPYPPAPYHGSSPVRHWHYESSTNSGKSTALWTTTRGPRCRALGIVLPAWHAPLAAAPAPCPPPGLQHGCQGIGAYF